MRMSVNGGHKGADRSHGETAMRPKTQATKRDAKERKRREDHQLHHKQHTVTPENFPKHNCAKAHTTLTQIPSGVLRTMVQFDQD